MTWYLETGYWLHVRYSRHDRVHLDDDVINAA
jgi:hypothetical protein